MPGKLPPGQQPEIAGIHCWRKSAVWRSAATGGFRAIRSNQRAPAVDPDRAFDYRDWPPRSSRCCGCLAASSHSGLHWRDRPLHRRQRSHRVHGAAAPRCLEMLSRDDSQSCGIGRQQASRVRDSAGWVNERDSGSAAVATDSKAAVKPGGPRRRRVHVRKTTHAVAHPCLQPCGVVSDPGATATSATPARSTQRSPAMPAYPVRAAVIRIPASLKSAAGCREPPLSSRRQAVEWTAAGNGNTMQALTSHSTKRGPPQWSQLAEQEVAVPQQRQLLARDADPLAQQSNPARFEPWPPHRGFSVTKRCV